MQTDKNSQLTTQIKKSQDDFEKTVNAKVDAKLKDLTTKMEAMKKELTAAVAKGTETKMDTARGIWVGGHAGGHVGGACRTTRTRTLTSGQPARTRLCIARSWSRPCARAVRALWCICTCSARSL